MRAANIINLINDKNLLMKNHLNDKTDRLNRGC
jgi:hypothetical protein